MTATIDLNYGVDWQARAVLSLVAEMVRWGESPLADVPGIRLQTFPLYNGRERHAAIVMDAYLGAAIMVSFGEDRVSDCIVVQTERLRCAPFNSPTVDDMTDEAYEARKAFNFGAVVPAAECVIDTLREFAEGQAGR